jgi:DMSO/TMAO reductase YedYZ heme-binding membrane subunit
VRRRIGQRAWRLLHYTTLLAFVGATAHGLMSGTDSPAVWAFAAYLVATVAVVFLLIYRITLGLASSLHPAERVNAPVREELST